MSRITMKDIAKRADVSQQTVSQILNKKDPWVSQATRDRVLQIVKELNYQPDYHARSLRSGKRHVIGVAGTASLGEIHDITASRIYSGIGKLLDDQDYHLTLIPGRNYKSSLDKVVRSRMVDGLILIMYATDYTEIIEQSIPLLKKEGIPFVIVHTSTRRLPCHHVGFNLEQTGYLATNFLLDEGYSEISLICNPARSTHQELSNGYKRALTRADGVENVFTLDAYPPTAQAGYEAGKAIISKHGVSQAYVIHSDSLAYGFIKALKEHGARVPEDVGVVGCDNIVRDEVFCSDLTTIDRKFEQRGSVAAEMLFTQIKNDRQPSSSSKMDAEDALHPSGEKLYLSYIAQPELIVRSSSKFTSSIG